MEEIKENMLLLLVGRKPNTNARLPGLRLI